MPSVSEAQRRAPPPASPGMSSIGIPKKVGLEFVRADKRKAKKKAGQFTLRKEGKGK